MSDLISSLKPYSACDISDALLKLSVPNSGFLADIVPLGPTNNVIYARVSTVQFVSKNVPQSEASNIPAGSHWTDLPDEGSVAVLSADRDGVSSALCGDILATRLCKRGIKGIVANGRVRDVSALTSLTAPVFSRGTSTVGAGMELKAWRVGDSLTIGGVKDKLQEVVKLLPGIKEADDKCLQGVREGMDVNQVFERYR
ncbi:RraA-like protein [Piedraia hortae CBS 480.64]|uniref:RraA-like protein n=1 Tax=Piedraia hortae CBS 480.64 TaxID=1314780 RepID=A0A6A7BYG8_9PEZI|nr:RraA-like protein [Piedraia hortae CBS 480.64]